MKRLSVIAALGLLGCSNYSVVPPEPVRQTVTHADTVVAGRRRCVFLTLSDGTHVMTKNQPGPCHKAFLKWARTHE